MGLVLAVVLVFEDGTRRDGVLECRRTAQWPIASALPDWDTVKAASGNKRVFTPALPSRSSLTFAPFPAFALVRGVI